MKEEFSWYFKPSDEEIKDIWKSGILTVDANVLLDLYRYHESTRNSLIASLKGFEKRLWLTRQATEEFIRNRTKVIVSSEKTFNEAKNEVKKLQDNFELTVTQLKGNRIIPADVADHLLDAITPAIDEAQEKIVTAQSAYPQYLKDDPILEELTEMFSGSIGEKMKDEELADLSKKAAERVEKEIPPGYLDKEKAGSRPFGDFFLWHQILQHSKNKETPIIFVTSERKEDWWEKKSGKTIGPRPELLKEASDFCGNRILIYQTDRFLQFASKQSGNDVDSKAVEEIRAIDTLRTDIENAVELIEQNTSLNTELLHEGELIINLHRPVRNITGSGSFDPQMISVPELEAKLIEAPKDNMPRIKLRAGAGNNRNFNLHIISIENGVLLPVGQYKLQYRAKCSNSEEQEDIIDITSPLIDEKSNK